MNVIIRVQHAADTGLYHPAPYLREPEGIGAAMQTYKSLGHATEGYPTLDAARPFAADLADRFGTALHPDDRVLVVELSTAGPDYVFMPINPPERTTPEVHT
jgi:hypothetical protein